MNFTTKFWCLIIITTLFLNFVFCQNSIVGEWETTVKNGQKATFLFKENGDFLLILGNTVIKNSDIENEVNKSINQESRIVVFYEIKYDKNPNWIDIVYLDTKNNEEVIRTRSIVEFLTPTKIRLDFENFITPGDSDIKDWLRPDDFNSKAVVLEKKS